MKKVSKRSADPKYDLSFPCPECGYKIKPAEILRTDDEHLQCPNCKKIVEYRPK